ncbi:hypothetical protein [Flavobacterium sp. HNIBRBA15423]|uniref:hypothetical protein n=1 Tax=Flavobacterium sp. HNIBRBA15423 TaxID=3458683 RepID=UPI004044F74B
MEEIDKIVRNEKELISVKQVPYLEFLYDPHHVGFNIEANAEGLEVLKNEIAKTIVACPKDFEEESSIFHMKETNSITFGEIHIESIEIVNKVPTEKTVSAKKESGIDIALVGCLLFVVLVGIIFIVGFITSVKYIIFQLF